MVSDLLIYVLNVPCHYLCVAQTGLLRAWGCGAASRRSGTGRVACKCADCTFGDKIELKKCAMGKCLWYSRTPLKNKQTVSKIKNTEGSAMSVGLPVVRLNYGLYVVQLSKWFVFVLMFKF